MLFRSEYQQSCKGPRDRGGKVTVTKIANIYYNNYEVHVYISISHRDKAKEGNYT